MTQVYASFVSFLCRWILLIYQRFLRCVLLLVATSLLLLEVPVLLVLDVNKAIHDASPDFFHSVLIHSFVFDRVSLIGNDEI